jgi:hypothetical protein
MRLKVLNTHNPGMHFDGGYSTQLKAEHGWSLTVSPRVAGVIATKPGSAMLWIPFSFIKNGEVLQESPSADEP